MKTVLFVCVHNSGCSQMTEAFFNHLRLPVSPMSTDEMIILIPVRYRFKHLGNRVNTGIIIK